MHRLVSAVCVSVLGACAGSGSGSRTAAPAPPPAPRPVAYRATTTRYLVVSRSTQELDMQGQVQTTSGTMRMHVTLALAPVDTGFSATFTIDSVLEASGPGVFAAQGRAALGQSITAHVSPYGRISDVAAPGEQALMVQIANAVRSFLPRLPAEGVLPGVTWTDSSEIEMPTGQVNILVRGTTTYSAGPWVERDGVEAIPLATTAATVLNGSGEQMGSQFTLDGTGRSIGTVYVGGDGRYLGGTSIDSVSGTVDVPAAGMLLPLRVVNVDSVRVLR